MANDVQSKEIMFSKFHVDVVMLYMRITYDILH